MSEQKHPLAEVFGYLPSDLSDTAKRYRENRLCPYNNKVPNCTKDKAQNPLGVCSVCHNGSPAITCPIRFREDWIITEDAASFFFPAAAKWSSLTEVRLNDANEKSAGNIDVVLVAYDKDGKIYDFGALEIQAVYISGNVREPFEHYMENPNKRHSMDWREEPNYPRPDYLSSSRKRLAPQLLFKGGILNSWGKKTAVALNRAFFESLPKIETCKKEEADLAWFIYDLIFDKKANKYKLTKVKEVYSKFQSSLLTITTAHPGDVEDFIKLLQGKLNEKLETPPDNKTIDLPIK